MLLRLRVKKKNGSQRPNQPKAHGNDGTNKVTDQASTSNAHKDGELDERGFRKQLDQLNEARLLRSKVIFPGESSSGSSRQNAPPPAVVDAWTSTNNTNIQPSGVSVLASTDALPMTVNSLEQPPSAFPMGNDVAPSMEIDPLPASLPPPSLPPPTPLENSTLPLITNGSKSKSSRARKRKQKCSPLSSIQRGEEDNPSSVPRYACNLIDKNTGSLKKDKKVAVVNMLKQLRSIFNDAKSAHKEARKPIMPPYELSLYLLRIYHKEVCYLFPFICFSTFMRAYRSFNGDDDAATGLSASASFGLGGSAETSDAHPLMFHCALFTMLSHAVKFATMKENDKKFLSRAFWECACAHFTPALVEENSLAAVQTFLILAVSFNSTLFSGDERKIPIEIAYRLGQHMRLDDDSDEYLRSVEEKEIRRKAWYGCVMMFS